MTLDFRTHVKAELRGISGQDEYADGMVEHDMHVGKLLDKLDELGIADNTLVFYSTDNGPHYNTWPDAAATPFRGEKKTPTGRGAGASRPWCAGPGKIEAGATSNAVMHHMDWLPRFAAVAGEPGVKEKLRKGHRGYKVHLDGYDFLPHLTGQANEGPRKEIFYFSDDGDLTALRYQDWKMIFMEQRAKGTFLIWANPFTPLRVPLIFNLRRDPYERAQITSNTYYDWLIDRAYLLVPAQAYVGQFLSTFKEFPPRQKAASFSLDQVLEALTEPRSTDRRGAGCIPLLIGLAIAALSLGCTSRGVPAASGGEPLAGGPRLILQITVDQLRGDLPLRYRDRLGAGGFRYLLDQGTHYANAHYQHANTETAPGHATLATGADPVAARDRLQRLGGPEHRVPSSTTPRTPAITCWAQSPSLTRACRPRNLRASSFGDELVIHTGGRSRVFSVSTKDRGAILPGGHAGQGLLVLQEPSGAYVTSSYYYDAYPALGREVERGEGRQNATAADAGSCFTIRAQLSSRATGTTAPGRPIVPPLGRTFPHDLGGREVLLPDPLAHSDGRRS